MNQAQLNHYLNQMRVRSRGTEQRQSKRKKNYKVTKRSGKFIITIKHFVRSKCDANSVMYRMYILYLCFYFHLAERRNLDDCFFCVYFSFCRPHRCRRFVSFCSPKYKLGRYFTRTNGPKRTQMAI